MISEHVEIEAKLAAPAVTHTDFEEWVRKNYEVVKEIRICGPDDYYESKDAVVRHRHDANELHELTVKKRKTDGSTRDRLEIDLHFASKTKTEDVAAFLVNTGFAPVLHVVKDAAIYWVKLSTSLTATFVMYDAWLTTKRGDELPGTRKRFIEVEAEKGCSVSHDTAKTHVRRQVKLLQARFGLGEPLNDSLYELFSGRKYQKISL